MSLVIVSKENKKGFLIILFVKQQLCSLVVIKIIIISYNVELKRNESNRDNPNHAPTKVHYVKKIKH